MKRFFIILCSSFSAKANYVDILLIFIYAACRTGASDYPTTRLGPDCFRW